MRDLGLILGSRSGPNNLFEGASAIPKEVGAKTKSALPEWARRGAATIPPANHATLAIVCRRIVRSLTLGAAVAMICKGRARLFCEVDHAPSCCTLCHPAGGRAGPCFCAGRK